MADLRVPTYESKVLPRQPGGPPAITPPGVAESGLTELGKQLGDILVARGEKLTREYDVSIATTAYNELRELSRLKMQALLETEGLEALESQKIYKAWHQDQSDTITTTYINNNDQSRIFTEFSNRRRESDLDVLSRHEVREHQRNKKEQIANLFTGAMAGVRLYAWDDEHRESFMADLYNLVDQNYSDRDNTSVKAIYGEQLREATLKKMLEDPEDDKELKEIEKYLKAWELELGDRYIGVKNLLKTQVDKHHVSEAFSDMLFEFEDNYEAMSDYVNNPKHWSALNLNFERAQKLDSRFQGMLNEKNRRDNYIRESSKRQIEENDYTSLIDSLDPQKNVDFEDLQEMAENRQISQEMFKYLTTAERKGPEEDNPFVKTDLYTRLAYREDIRTDAKNALIAGNITNETFFNIGKDYANKKYMDGATHVARALAPSTMDQWNPDKHLRYTDAVELYRAKIASGVEPDLAAREVVDQYVGEMKRTLIGLAKPKYLIGDKAKIENLEDARIKTIKAWQKQEISIDELRVEIRNIQQLWDLVINSQSITERTDIQKELDRRKK